MTITAKTMDSEEVIAIDLTEADREKGYYYCKHCGGEMKLVLPKKGIINHFRHLHKGNCEYAGESMKHIEGKSFIYNHFKNNPIYKSIELEMVCGDRIGDVVLHPSNSQDRPVVVEIQNSPISTEEINRRFSDWNRNGYDMLWIVTDNIVHPDPTDGEMRIAKWVRMLHTIYNKEVYIYSNGYIFSATFEDVERYNEWYDESGEFCESEYIPKSIKTLEMRVVDDSPLKSTRRAGWGYSQKLAVFDWR